MRYKLILGAGLGIAGIIAGIIYKDKISDTKEEVKYRIANTLDNFNLLEIIENAYNYLEDLAYRTFDAPNEGVDVVVRRSGENVILWPISQPAKEWLTGYFKDSQKKQGGYHMHEACFPRIYTMLHEELGPHMKISWRASEKEKINTPE